MNEPTKQTKENGISDERCEVLARELCVAHFTSGAVDSPEQQVMQAVLRILDRARIDKRLAEAQSQESWDKLATVSVNACEGMLDHALAVACARDAIRRLLRHIPPSFVGSDVSDDVFRAKRALIALGDLP